MTLHDEAEVGRILLCAREHLTGSQFRALAYLLSRRPPGCPIVATDRQLGREFGCDPGHWRKLLLPLKTTVVPSLGRPAVEVAGGTRGRQIIVARMPRSEPAPAARPAPAAAPRGEAIGISPRAVPMPAQLSLLFAGEAGGEP